MGKKIAENSTSSLYNCINAAGIAFHSIEALSRPLYGVRWDSVGGPGGVGGREIRRRPPSLFG